MICYKDRSWCSQKCGNLECDRNFTEEERKRAIAWWGGGENGPPVAYMDFRTEECGYKEPNNGTT